MSTAPFFEVHVSKDTFKFNAAHFVAFHGFRERLHGHNYKVAVRLLGSRHIGADGYLIDFQCVKEVTKKVCKELNEHFLCPTLSPVLNISTFGDPESVKLECQDGSVFLFPRSDCAMLPIAHATTEELAIYLWGKILKGLDGDYLLKRGIHTMEINVSESLGQDATFRRQISSSTQEDNDQEEDGLFDVASYIMQGDVVPRPCPSNPGNSDNHVHTCSEGNCQKSKTAFSKKLDKLAEMINTGRLGAGDDKVSGKDLEALVGSTAF